MTHSPHTLPWHDRFTTPEPEQLIAPVREAEIGIEPFETLRERLVEHLTLTEGIGWHGIPWRWSFSYAPAGGDPIAFLVPEPGRPQLCCEIPMDAADAITASKPHKSVREGLARGRLVGSTLWTEFELTAMSRPLELAELVRVLAEHVGARAT